MIALVGRISTRTYEGQDGRKNYVTEVVVSEVSFAGEKKEDVPAQNTDDVFVPMGEEDSDLPF